MRKTKVENCKKSQKGITLVSLVVTVILLIMLASIATHSGIEVVNSTKMTAFTTELKIMQTQVNKMYEEKKAGEDISNYGIPINEADANVQEQARKVFAESASGITDYSNYRYFSKQKIEELGIEGAIITAKGANDINIKTNIIQAVEAVTGLATHKIQVFTMN